MLDLELWPWGVTIITLLSILIGWFARDILSRKQIEKKNSIIQSQEREYIRLADKHVESTKTNKQVVKSLEEELNHNHPQENQTPSTSVVVDSHKEDKELINNLHDEVDRLKIENQKLSSVPQALYVEKNTLLSESVRQLKRKHKAAKSRLKQKNKELKKLNRKLEKAKSRKREQITIIETIDFKKLKRLLKNLPVKKIIAKRNKGSKSV